jgi:lia operon protein LiaG
MRKAAKIWLIVAASLVLLGIIIFGGVMAFLKWDILKLTTNKYETNTYEISDAFSNVCVNTDTADIVFLASDDGKCKVVCYEEEKMKHSVTVSDGTLSINAVDTRKWYEHISVFSTGDPMITVYLPKPENISVSLKNSTGDISLPKDIEFESIDILGSTGDVKCDSSASGTIKIKRTTGHINVENVEAGSLDLSVSTGNITALGVKCEGDLNISVSTGKTNLTEINCKDLISTGNTGDISLKNVIALGKFSIERSTGDVRFDGCDAAELFVKTDTGDVVGSLLSEKVFITKTDTGDVSVPNSVVGGRCEITTDTGDIRINILG